METLYQGIARKPSPATERRYADDPDLARAYAGLVRESRRAKVATRAFARAVNAGARALVRPTPPGKACSLCGGRLEPFATGDPAAPTCWGCIDRIIAEDKARRIAGDERRVAA